jgi:hypothetical protein
MLVKIWFFSNQYIFKITNFIFQMSPISSFQNKFCFNLALLSLKQFVMYNYHFELNLSIHLAIII